MHNVTPFSAGKHRHDRSSTPAQQREQARREQRRRRFGSIASTNASESQASGFSMRLNLLCNLAGERPLNEGRALDIAALCETWRESEVRQWLCEDMLPAPEDLRALIAFLLDQAECTADPTHWEAFILYGAEWVNSPVDATLPEDHRLLALAASLVTDATAEQRRPPGSYDPDAVLRRAIGLLRDLRITNGQALSAGHRTLITAQLFDG